MCHRASRAREFVGRAAELALLEAALAAGRAAASAGAAFVCGESGIGKTRLLRELERRAGDRGARVRARRVPGLRRRRAGLRAHRLGAAAARARARCRRPSTALVGPARDELARLVPEWGAGRRRTSDRPRPATRSPRPGCSGCCAGCSTGWRPTRPSLFAVEDLHWADRSTLELLSSLLRGLRDERVLLVCTYRSDELHRRHPLRPFLAEEERREVVAARRARALLARGARGAGRGHPRRRPPTRAGRAAARALRGQRVLRRGAAGRLGRRGGPLPPSLREVLSLRLEALPRRRARGAARRRGRRPRRPAIGCSPTVAALPEAALLEALREAVAHHVLVHDSDGYAFRHALLEEAAYADLLPGERTALHLALAEALSADPSLAGARARAPSWPTTGRRRTACPRRSPPTCRPAWRPSGPRPSRRPRSTSSARSRSGTSSRTPRSAPSSTLAASWRARRTPRTAPASPTGRSRSGAGRWSSPTAPATWSRRRWRASASASTCGPAATATPPWPPTARRSASCRPSRRRPSWRASSPPKPRSSCCAGPARRRGRAASVPSRPRARPGRAP